MDTGITYNQAAVTELSRQSAKKSHTQLPPQPNIERHPMLKSKMQINEINTRNPSMIEINETDLENVSVLAQQLAITVLFSVLHKHDKTLADDIAFELAEAQRRLPQILPENVLPHIQGKLQDLQDMLLNKQPTGSDPVRAS